MGSRLSGCRTCFTRVSKDESGGAGADKGVGDAGTGFRQVFDGVLRRYHYLCQCRFRGFGSIEVCPDLSFTYASSESALMI